MGIASPSRLFRYGIGYQIPAGEALGIRDGFGLVRNAMDDLFGVTTTSFSSKLRLSSKLSTQSLGKSSVMGKTVSVVQNIYSEAKTAADLMQEARYQQEMAVIFGV